MSVQYRIDPTLKLVFARAWDELTDSMILDYYATLVKEPLFNPAFNCLSYNRDITSNKTSHHGILTCAQHSPFLNTSKQAMVVARTLEKGIAHQFGVAVAKSESYYLVCEDLNSAIVWLGLESLDQEYVDFLVGS